MTRRANSWLRGAACGGLALLAFSCGRPVAPDAPIPLTLKLRSRDRSLPFTCYALHVTGPGITTGGNPAAGNPCARPGVGSSYHSTAGGEGSLSLSVPAGRTRLIQVVGVQGPACPTGRNLGDTLRDYDGGADLPAEITGLFEVGRVETDLLGPATLEIDVAHDAGDPRGLTFCRNGGPIAALRLSPGSVSVPVSKSQSYDGSGGFPPYELKNAVGGTLAGAIFAVGVSETNTSLTIRDSRGNETTVTGRTFAGLDVDVWLKAESLDVSFADGQPITSWDNSGNTSVLDQVLAGGNGAIYRQTAGPNSRPIVEFDGTEELTQTALTFNGGSPSDLRLLVVAQRDGATGGTLFCVTNMGTCSGAVDYFHLRSPSAGNTTFTVRKNPTHLIHAGPVPDGSPYRLHQATLVPGRITYFQDGSTVASTEFSSFGNLSFGGGSEAIRVGGNGGADYFFGNIAEIILYLSDPGDGRIEQVADYLKLKYGFAD